MRPRVQTANLEKSGSSRQIPEVCRANLVFECTRSSADKLIIPVMRRFVHRAFRFKSRNVPKVTRCSWMVHGHVIESHQTPPIPGHDDPHNKHAVSDWDEFLLPFVTTRDLDPSSQMCLKTQHRLSEIHFAIASRDL